MNSINVHSGAFSDILNNKWDLYIDASMAEWKSLDAVSRWRKFTLEWEEFFNMTILISGSHHLSGWDEFVFKTEEELTYFLLKFEAWDGKVDK